MGVKGDFMVKVMRNERVAAVLPMQENWLPLSNLDFMLPTVDVSVFFCYKKPTGGENLFTFGSMVSVLKKALAQTLVSYYAFAGELVQNSVGEVELLCNNHGVEFLEAFADLELRHLNLHNPDESVEGKLVPKKKQGVLSVQVTQVKCGGLVVACTFDHRVADAYSANMFLVSWAEMAQSKPLSQRPSFQRSLLNPRRPGHYDPSLNDMYVSISALKPPKDPQPSVSNDPLISRIYYIEAEQLSWLESLASDNGCKRTKLEAFSAFLWKMVTAGEDGSGKICRMGIVVDGRKRISEGDSEKAAMMASYFGNVVSIPFAEKNIGELKEMPTGWRPIVLSLLWPRYMPVAENEDDGSALVVSSGQRFPVSKVDFGWGKPAFGSYHFPWGGEAGYVMPMPSPLGNGDWVVYMHLFKRQLEMIEMQAAHLLRPLTCDYLNF
ncbi:hypothetical protein F0562_015339 [Nyssa sinensis]|uniref:Shikimate O-hydroxycinnamoyltransferase n=1 Tax=Nyssa sinensis TaxID=561372 RepID=A0A5J4ZK46_9ASTE|nr:hypothetical protein F0562_015339 [Nyssa sinensis]